VETLLPTYSGKGGQVGTALLLDLRERTLATSTWSSKGSRPIVASLFAIRHFAHSPDRDPPVVEVSEGTSTYGGASPQHLTFVHRGWTMVVVVLALQRTMGVADALPAANASHFYLVILGHF
jgi:hypothetical protein